MLFLAREFGRHIQLLAMRDRSDWDEGLERQKGIGLTESERSLPTLGWRDWQGLITNLRSFFDSVARSLHNHRALVSMKVSLSFLSAQAVTALLGS
jgi:hypothetical protein